MINTKRLKDLTQSEKILIYHGMAERGILENDPVKTTYNFVKMVNSINYKKLNKPFTEENVKTDFHIVSAAIESLSQLTPIQFQQAFPIKKTYDGEKYEMKDYFYAKEILDQLDPHKPIGGEVDNIIAEYQNDDIFHLFMRLTEVVDNMRILNGEKTLMEEFAEQFGLTTYKMYEDQNGKKFAVDQKTGKSTRVYDPLPSYLRVVK